jgi:hypothetical protein
MNFDRRTMCATLGALAVAGRARADDVPIFDDSKPTTGVAIPSVQHTAEMDAAPLIKKTVHKLWNDAPTIKEPNALQFTPKGTLLILDQVDPNKVFEVNPSDGKILRSVQTESIHGSGICIDASGNWIITSTKALQGPPVTLVVDPASGKTLKKWVTPGWGFYGPDRPPRPGQPPETPSGGHDVKWAGNGRYWMAVPASGRIFLMDEASGKPVRSIVAPVNRTHGLAIDGNYLWSVAADFWQIQKLDARTGKVVGKIQLDKNTDPAIHGLELKDGVLWYCDAGKGWVCNLT